MTMNRFSVQHLDQLPRIESPHPEGDRTPVRAALGIESFGVNVMTGAEVGDPIIGRHDHADDDDPKHEELYLVLSGGAEFRLDDTIVKADRGTFVHVPDTTVEREATALEPDTSILVVGAEPGKPFAVSGWDEVS